MDYFEYEREIARDHLIPLLRAHGAMPPEGRLLDVGCGYGGTIAAFRELAPGLTAIGLDLDESMVAQGRERLGSSAELVSADFFGWSGGGFDLILLRDVLEHIRRPEAALQRAASMLSGRGFLFVSFAPFSGPFGGHQHNGAGLLSYVPWLQLLAPATLRSRLRIEGNAYKTEAELQKDTDSVLETRLTLRRFLEAAEATRLSIVARTSYLSRPDYRIKFGLPAVRLPAFGPWELLATGVEALLQRQREGR